MTEMYKCDLCSKAFQGRPKATLKIHSRLTDGIHHLKNNDGDTVNKADVCEKCLERKLDFEIVTMDEADITR